MLGAAKAGLMGIVQGSAKFNFNADFTQMSLGNILNQTTQSGHVFSNAGDTAQIGIEGSPKSLSLIGAYTKRVHNSPYVTVPDLYDKNVDINMTGLFYEAGPMSERCTLYTPCGFYIVFSGNEAGSVGQNLYIANGITSQFFNMAVDWTALKLEVRNRIVKVYTNGTLRITTAANFTQANYALRIGFLFVNGATGEDLAARVNTLTVQEL